MKAESLFHASSIIPVSDHRTPIISQDPAAAAAAVQEERPEFLSAMRAAKDDDDEAAGSGVPELPLHVTERILCCVSPLASARLATVCKSWASTVAARLARPVPHLYVCTPPDNTTDRRGVVVSVALDGGAAEAAPARVRVADTTGLQCVGATRGGGRLAFASWWSPSVVLANPVTGALRAVDTGLPRRVLVLASGGADAFLCAAYDGGLELWCAAGGEKAGEWSGRAVAAPPAHRNTDVVSVASCDGGCFYVLHADGQVSTIDAASPPPLTMEKLPVARLPAHVDLNRPPKGHLVECDGEVLFVVQVLGRKAADPGTVSSCDHQLAVAGFEVYRLDAEGGRWTSVAALPDGRALFVSPGSAFAARAAETAGCSSNCIYFVGKEPSCASCDRGGGGGGGSTWGVYSMDARKVLLERAVSEPGRCTAATWFLPRVN